MNRGSVAHMMIPEHDWNRFNEAPIHESGKLSDRRGGCQAILGFNEAPIHESGKLPRSP